MRLVDCVRSDGKIVDPINCRTEGKRLPILLRPCEIPCSRNCEISEWSNWNECPNKCNFPGVQKRVRYVLSEAQHGGQPCLHSNPLEGM